MEILISTLFGAGCGLIIVALAWVYTKAFGLDSE